MKPLIFRASESDFRNQGQGTLADCISCKVTEELNGSYELELTTPKDGLHSEYCVARNIIVCRASYSKQRQAFRIYKVKQDINRTLTVYARHISYDLSNYPVYPISYSMLKGSIEGINKSIPYDLHCPFKIAAHMPDKEGQFRVTVPSSARSWLGGQQGSIIDVFGGEWDWDNYNIVLRTQRGNGSETSPVTTIKYAKNLTKYDKEVCSDSQYSHIIAIWKKGQDDGIDVAYSDPAHVKNVTNQIRYGYYDASAEFDEKPSKETLNLIAGREASGKKGRFETNISIDFVQLDNERIELGDFVRIYNDRDNYVSRIIKTEWNVLLDRYETVEVGDKKANIVDAIQSLNSSPSTTSSSSSPTLEHVTAYNGGMEFFCYGRQVTCHLNGLTYAQLLAYVVAGKWRPLAKCRWTIQGEHNNGIVLGIAEIDTNGQFAAYYYSGFNETKKNWASDWKLYGVTTWISNS